MIEMVNIVVRIDKKLSIFRLFLLKMFGSHFELGLFCEAFHGAYSAANELVSRGIFL